MPSEVDILSLSLVEVDEADVAHPLHRVVCRGCGAELAARARVGAALRAKREHACPREKAST